MERFEGAYQMTYNLKKKSKKLQVIDKNMKKPTRKDLVFLDESPDYCERNQTYKHSLLWPNPNRTDQIFIDIQHLPF